MKFIHTILDIVGIRSSRKKDFIKVSDSIIPLPKARFCGSQFKNDKFFLKSAEIEANRLIDNFNCNSSSHILDIGCGQGRLPIGLLRVIGEVNYFGIDVDFNSIEWCKKHIQKDHQSYKFIHLNLFNERYNINGIKIEKDFRFQLESGSFDIIYLFSVFTHTTEEDMKIYLRECSRILNTNGRMFFTTFAELNVPNIEINPNNYQMKCGGALHIVRYNRDYLFSILDECGFSILKFTHGTEIDGQSAVYLKKK